jgi:hypothetical protein
VRPKEVLREVLLDAKSGMLVRPIITAPASFSFAATAASFGANSSWPGMTNPDQPSVVTRFWMLVLAFTTMGTPHRGGRGPGVMAAALSSRSAVSRALWKSRLSID